MARTLSNDLRKRLVNAVESGMAARAAGRQLAIAASTATSIIKQWRDRGSYEPERIGGHRRPILGAADELVETLVREHGEWTEAELAAELCDKHGICVHPSTVGRYIRKQGWRYKKNSVRQRTGS